MVEDVPIIDDIAGWFQSQAGELFKIVGLDVIIELIKEVPNLIASILELLLMTDDIVLLIVKITRFIFGDAMDLVIIFIENLLTLADPILDFVFSAIKALEESKEIPAIVIYSSPLFLGLYLLYYIISSI